jgi:FG-GAP repeat
MPRAGSLPPELARVVSLGVVSLVVALLPSPALAGPPRKGERPAVAEPPTSGAEGARRGGASDFNGDGFADLAIGVPKETIGGADNLGAVNVLYGSAFGLTARGDQLWHQDAPGVPGSGEPGDLFSFALSAGDFNGDGYCDLAIGAPFEDTSGGANAGSVTLLSGSPGGLTAAGARIITEDARGVPGAGEAGDQFAYALSAGDFDGDGFDDLAAGVQREDVGPVANAGAVVILFGSKDGVRAAGSTRWTQSAPGVADLSERGDEGMAHVLRGSLAGVTPRADLALAQGAPGMGDDGEPGDAFGEPLAAGDIDADGLDDLVIGAPTEDVSGHEDAGALNVLRGSRRGAVPASPSFWHQDAPGVPGSAGGVDGFAEALAVGDVDADGYADVAASAEFDDEAGPDASGAVGVFFGSAAGLTAVGAQLWTQDSPGVPGAAEDGDHFGSALAIARFGSGRAADLAIGVHFEQVGALDHAGMIEVVPGSSAGPSGDGVRGWTQDSPGILERVERRDFFPFALSAAG